MPEILVIVLVASVLLAALAYRHARRLHWRIEELSPGFNAMMRHLHRKDRA